MTIVEVRYPRNNRAEKQGKSDLVKKMIKWSVIIRVRKGDKYKRDEGKTKNTEKVIENKTIILKLHASWCMNIHI